MKSISLFFGLTIFFLFSSALQAQVLSPRAEEVRFYYETEFLIGSDESDSSPEEWAEYHMSHLFGHFHSPTLTRRVGVNPDLIGGVGGLQFPTDVKVLKSTKREDGFLIRYRARGKMLLHKKAAQAWVAQGGVEIPLPYDMSKIYNEKCTDEYYDSEGDYWYFYDPYRKNCRYLLKEPFAKVAQIEISSVKGPQESSSMRLPELRGDNGNGSLFSIYFIQGFDEKSTARGDEGRKAFNQLRRDLKNYGFEENIVNADPRRTQIHFRQTLHENLNIEVKALLVNTQADSRGVSFARFFKDAVYAADVLIYAGHSGLGGNLNIETLEEKAGPFVFNNSKKQIFYFESCSSYSYYLEDFKNRKAASSLHLISNGLSSYYGVGNDSMNVFLEFLFDRNLKSNPRWLDVLEAIEKPLEGSSYLINVGGFN